jgi:hypothetical protein
MSLLNDALKRASQSQYGHDTVRIHIPPVDPTVPAAPAIRAIPAMPAMSVAVAEPHPKSGVGWLPILVVLTVAVAGAFILLAHFSARHRAHAVAIVPVSRPIPPAPKPAPPPVTVKAVAVTAPAPAPLPPLKLQGISFYNAHWEAIINGRTVYVGNRIGGFRVAVISGNKVWLIAPDGSRKRLVLGQ